MTPTERALIAEYEAVLEREGLGLVERQHERSLSSANRLRGKEFYREAREVFWREVTAGANKLPRNYPLRLFLLEVAKTGNLLGSCRTHQITHERGRWAFRGFLRSIGLGNSRPARYS